MAVIGRPKKPRSRTERTNFWKFAHELGDLNESDRIRLIKKGFSADFADAAKETFQLTSQAMGVLLNVSVATYERRRRDSRPLDAGASERLDLIAAVARHQPKSDFD